MNLVMKLPAKINPPTVIKPLPNIPTSPITPMQVGKRPAPTTNAMGIDKEIAIFLAAGGTISERMAKPDGKKQTEHKG
jgi:hypothetical protein